MVSEDGTIWRFSKREASPTTIPSLLNRRYQNKDVIWAAKQLQDYFEKE
jgi:hypothetical protein